MTKTRTERSDPLIPFKPFSPLAPDQALRAYQPILEGLTELNGKAMMSFLELNREWTGFLMRRVEEDIALVHDLTKCSEPSDAFRIWSDFYVKSFSDYQSELSRLVTLNGKGLEQTTRTLQDAIGSIARGMPVAA